MSGNTVSPLMCTGIRRVGASIGTLCPQRASVVVDGAALCGTHARLAKEGKLQVKYAPEERRKRKVVAVKDALYDFLCDSNVNLPEKSLSMMAQDIVLTLENMK